MATYTKQSEYNEALVLVEWLTLHGYKFHHSPNETYTRSWNQKRKNKALGVSPGFPDYTIIANGKLIVIELKKARGKRGGANGSVVSEHQQEWIDSFNTIGIPAQICYGADEAIEFIKNVTCKRTQ